MSSAVISYTKEHARWTYPPLRVNAFLILLSLSFVASFGLLALFLTAFLPSTRTETMQTNGVALPPDGFGIYESCSLDNDIQNCEQRLQAIARAGFKLVINYDEMGASPSETIAYLNQAQALGIKIIFAMNDPIIWEGKTDLKTYYPAFGQTCQCATNADFIAQVVDLVKTHPALWGYYIGDEVDPSYHAIFSAYASMIQQLDPNHPRLFITVGQSDPTYVALLRPFTDSADVIGDDYYPVGDDPNAGRVQDTGKMAHAVQQVADASKKGAAIVLQSFNWNQYPNEYPCIHFSSICNAFPTEAQMQSMLQQTLQSSHPRMVLWYSYYNILSSDNPAQHWQDLQQAIHSVDPLSPTPNTPTPSPPAPTAQRDPTANPGTASPTAQGTPLPGQSHTPAAAPASAFVFPWRFFFAMVAILVACVSVIFIRTVSVRKKP